MNKYFRIMMLIILVLYFMALPAESIAGTYYAGAKYWYASWDSAASQVMEKIVADIVKTDVEPRLEPIFGDIRYTTTSKNGNGSLGGPVFGFETEDRKWFFSAEFLFFNSFKQEVEVEGSAGSIHGTKTVDIDVDRKDYKVNACYIINKYFNAYIGYKYETYSLETYIKLPLYFDLPPDTFRYDYDTKMHLLMPGVGAVLPVDENENYKVGFNIGTMGGIMDMKDNVHDEEMEVKGKYAVIGEIYASVKLIDRLILRLGYGYERIKGELYIKDRDIRTEATEIFHGINGTCMYIF